MTTDLLTPEVITIVLGLFAHAWHGVHQAGKREERRRADNEKVLDRLDRLSDDFDALRADVDYLHDWSQGHEREFHDRRQRQHPPWPPQSAPRSPRRHQQSHGYSRGYAR